MWKQKAQVSFGPFSRTAGPFHGRPSALAYGLARMVFVDVVAQSPTRPPVTACAKAALQACHVAVTHKEPTKEPVAYQARCCRT